MEQQLFFHQRFLLTPHLLTSLEVLAKPLPELAEWLDAKIEENPLLIADEMMNKSPIMTRGFQKTKIAESSLVVEQRDLYATLESQAREAFENPTQLKESIQLIHNIDEKGFLPKETKDSTVLSILQTFDPPGIAARSVQESLLLQLKRKQNVSSLSLNLIQDHYDDLLHNRRKKICKTLKIDLPKLKYLIENDLAPLLLAPAANFKKQAPVPWIPDLSLIEKETGWAVEINTSLLPSISIGLSYEVPLNDSETRKYLHWKDKEAKFVLESIRKRNATLQKLGRFLLKTQKEYLEGKKDRPELLTFEETSLHLGMHRSTLYRAVHHKVISTPRGIFSLSTFFRHAGAIPSIEGKIEQLIMNEDKNQPLTDAAIAKKLGQLGLPCTVRTVTKYRNSLHFPTAKMRKT